MTPRGGAGISSYIHALHLSKMNKLNSSYFMREEDYLQIIMHVCI